MGYKSTSDEEDNDSDDNTQKPRLAKDYEPQKEEPKKEDVIMKLIEKDRALVRRDLEARLARVIRA